MTDDKYMSQLAKKINRKQKSATSTLFSLQMFKYVRAVIFVLCAMYAANCILFSNSLKVTEIINALIALLVVPVVLSVIYLPLIKLVHFFININKNDLVNLTDDDYTVKKNLHDKATKLEEDRRKIFHYELDTERPRYIKIPLAIICALIIVYNEYNTDLAGFQSFIGGSLKETTPKILFAVCILFIGAVFYLVNSFAFFATDFLILFPYTRYVWLGNASALLRQTEKMWDEVEKTRKSEIAAEIAAEEARIKKQQELENRKKGEELYKKAIEAEEPNEELIKQAADLGYPEACFDYGKKLLLEMASDLYTSEEKEEIAENAAEYLSIPAKNTNTEAKFLWLSARIQYESNTKSGWTEILDSLRKIKKSGNLPSNYGEMCDMYIRTVVNNINRLSESSSASFDDDIVENVAKQILGKNSENDSKKYDDSGAYGYPAERGASYHPDMPPIDVSDI